MAKPKRELPPALRENADRLKRGEPLAKAKGTKKQPSRQEKKK